MPPDLEPASALAERISSLLHDQHFEARVAELIVERDSVREPLETQLDELRRRLHEQADVIAERDRRIAELQSRIYELEGQLANTHDVLVNLRGERNELETEALKAERAADARIAELEAQLEKTAVDAAEIIADLKHTISMHEERIDREQNRIASLEADLSAARIALRGTLKGTGLEAAESQERIASLEAQLASAPRWIPVEERLPFQGSPVLTLEAGGTMPMVCVYHDGTWYNIDNGSSYDVTHWMPLPELPPPAAQKEPL